MQLVRGMKFWSDSNNPAIEPPQTEKTPNKPKKKRNKDKDYLKKKTSKFSRKNG